MINCKLAFLYNIQGGQLILIIVAILVLFGSKRLPEIARTLGKALHEFRKAASDTEREIVAATQAPAVYPSATPMVAKANDQDAEKTEETLASVSKNI